MKLKFLIDTGAECSIIQPNYIGYHSRTKCSSGINALQSDIHTESLITTPIFKEFNEPQNIKLEFLELSFESIFAGIIGSDILFPLEAHIDFVNRRLFTRNAQIRLHFD